jgi:hypothetical protein
MNQNKRNGHRAALALSTGSRNGRQHSRPPSKNAPWKLRKPMNPKSAANRNQYQLAMEKNQNGKYVVRIRAAFGQHSWVLPTYFLASSFDRAIKKLEETLQLLQRHEDRLWFWGVERSDDPNLAAELLKEFGLELDRRNEFPRKMAAVAVPAERPVPAFLLAPVRRVLADSVATARAAAASD